MVGPGCIRASQLRQVSLSFTLSAAKGEDVVHGGAGDGEADEGDADDAGSGRADAVKRANRASDALKAKDKDGLSLDLRMDEYDDDSAGALRVCCIAWWHSAGAASNLS